MLASSSGAECDWCLPCWRWRARTSSSCIIYGGEWPDANHGQATSMGVGARKSSGNDPMVGPQCCWCMCHCGGIYEGASVSPSSAAPLPSMASRRSARLKVLLPLVAWDVRPLRSPRHALNMAVCCREERGHRRPTRHCPMATRLGASCGLHNIQFGVEVGRAQGTLGAGTCSLYSGLPRVGAKPTSTWFTQSTTPYSHLLSRSW